MSVYLSVAPPDGFGKWGDADWPRYAGYSLGYAMVRAWLDVNDATAARSATVAANDILAPWKAGALEIRYPIR